MDGKENDVKKRYAGPVKTYKFKLYKSTHNDRLHWMINAAGLSYNHCLSLYKRYYRLYHKTLNKFNLQKHLTKEKKWHKTVDGVRCLRYPYLSAIDAQALQNIVERIANAYHLFFVNLENGKKTSPPKYKKVRKYKSFTLKQTGWKLNEDYGFSSFVNILKYVAKQHGTVIVQVDRFFPSTQICHSCGGRDYFVKDLKIREWECPFCQEHHDRDRNAAMNILAEGQRMLSEA